MTPEQPRTGNRNTIRSGWEWSIVVSAIDDSRHLLVTDRLHHAYAIKSWWGNTDDMVVLHSLSRDIRSFWSYIAAQVEALTLELLTYINIEPR